MKIEECYIDFDENGGWALVNGVIIEGFKSIRVGLGEVYFDGCGCHIPVDNIEKSDFTIAERDKNGYEKEQKDFSEWVLSENKKCLDALAKSLATSETINKIQSEYECYRYDVFDNEYDNISTVNNLKGYEDGKYACMIEVFSDLVDPNDYEPSSLTGDVVTDEYIDAIVKERKNMRTQAMEIENDYKKQNVKVTLSKWNEGCEYGMAMYIWIPYQ